jgi:hypothetical protein
MRTIKWLGAAVFFGTLMLACGGTGGEGGDGEPTGQASEDLTCGVNCECDLAYQRCMGESNNAQQQCLCKNTHALCHLPHLALQVCPCAPDDGDCWLNGLK